VAFPSLQRELLTSAFDRFAAPSASAFFSPPGSTISFLTRFYEFFVYGKSLLSGFGLKEFSLSFAWASSLFFSSVVYPLFKDLMVIIAFSPRLSCTTFVFQ